MLFENVSRDVLMFTLTLKLVGCALYSIIMYMAGKQGAKLNIINIAMCILKLPSLALDAAFLYPAFSFNINLLVCHYICGRKWFVFMHNQV